MVAKMCSEATDAGDGAGVEAIVNEKCNLEGHGETPSIFSLKPFSHQPMAQQEAPLGLCERM